MEFLPYLPAKRREWDQFVESHPRAGFGHLSSNFLLEDETGRTINRSLMIYENPTRLIGVLPLRESKSAMSRVFTIRTLASNGGPLFHTRLTAPEQSRLLDSLIAHVKLMAEKLGVDRITVIYPSMMEGRLSIDLLGYLPLRKYHFAENNMLGTYHDLRRSDSDLLACLAKDCRKSMRKAEQAGVKAREIESREEWLGCEPLNEQTLGPQKYSRRAMEIVWDEFIAKGYARAYVAQHENRTVSIEVIQIFNKNAYLWIAFNARPILDGANNYLIWHCLRDSRNFGATSILLGSFEFSDDAKTQGISDFKRKFGGTPYYVLGGTFLRKRAKYQSILLMTEVARYVFTSLRRWGGAKGARSNKPAAAPPSPAGGAHDERRVGQGKPELLAASHGESVE